MDSAEKRNSFRLSGRPWLGAWLLSLVISLVLFQVKKPLAPFRLAFFMECALIGFCFWAFVGQLDSVLRRFPRIVLAALVGVFFTLLLVATIFVYGTFRSFLTSDLLMVIVANPGYLPTLVRAYLFNVIGLVFAAASVFSAIVWFRQGRNAVMRPTAKKAAVMVLAALIAIGGIFHIRNAYADSFIPLDTSFLTAVFQTIVSANRETLHSSPTRMPVARPDRPSPVNVVLVMTESLGRFGVPGYDGDSRAMPFLASWLERDKERFIAFRRFYANASLSVISIPSLVTGVEPFESSKKLHAAPLLWDWAKAAGCRTALVSSQLFSWGGFRGFFLHPGPDFQFTAESSDLPTVNDIGIDELAAVEELRGFVNRLPEGERFLAVYYSGALHAPFQQTSRYLDVQPRFELPFQNALFITDQMFERIVRTLEDKGFLDSTVLIITADHAEYPLQKTVPRVLSYYEEVIHIPCLIRIPPVWERDHPEAAARLRANADRLASNIDLLPTIVDMMGLDRNNGPLLAPLGGTSLCRLLPERFLVALNTNEIRGAEQEGFGIYWPGKSFIFSTLDGPKYFDLTADPEQNQDRWEDIPAAERTAVLSVIEENGALRRIHRKWLAKKR